MLIDSIKNRLQTSTRNDLFRKRWVISEREGNHIVIENKKCINFCSNDYLGITTHKKIKKIFSQAAMIYGLGSGGSAQVSGYSTAHERLEHQFADFLQRDRALLLNTGYQANIAAITALVTAKNNIIADKHCHASLIDGILLSRAKYFRYRHQDITQAEKLLNKTAHALLITEGVFSIDGSLSHLSTLSKYVKKYSATLLVDDAHGIGWLGNTGAGSCEYHQLTQQDISCLTIPLGKAFGSLGAIIAGKKEIIEAISQFGRSYRYTTALPPALCCTTSIILEIIKKDHERREKLRSLILFFLAEAKKRELPLFTTDITPIKTISVASEKIAIHIQEKLIQTGFFVACIRPPTVAKNSSCIRISLNCLHTEFQISQLLDLFKEIYDYHPSETQK